MSRKTHAQVALEVLIQEREACADLADEMGSPKIATAIRARTCTRSGHLWIGGVCGTCGVPNLVLVG